MKVIDLTEDYKKQLLEKNDLEAYESGYPALFEYYFKYWGKRRFFRKVLSAKDVDARKEKILSRLEFIEKKFREAGFNISDLKIILFVGQNTTNGHAFLDGKEFAVWLPIEAYTNRQRVDVFVTHEIFHALHYSQNPAFYFGELRNLQNIIVGDNLCVEGLATYATKKIMGFDDGKVLWADYISTKDIRHWLAQCKTRQKELFNWILKNFDLKIGKSELFGGTNSRDIFHSRSGYWAGLRIVEAIAKEGKYELADLLKISRQGMLKNVKTLLNI